MSALDGGQAMMDALSQTSIDYVCLGNHEFDLGLVDDWLYGAVSLALLIRHCLFSSASVTITVIVTITVSVTITISVIITVSVIITAIVCSVLLLSPLLTLSPLLLSAARCFSTVSHPTSLPLATEYRWSSGQLFVEQAGLATKLKEFTGKCINSNGSKMPELSELPTHELIAVGEKTALIGGFCIADGSIYSQSKMPNLDPVRRQCCFVVAFSLLLPSLSVCDG